MSNFSCRMMAGRVAAAGLVVLFTAGTSASPALGQTQYENTMNAVGDAMAADKELNFVYQKLIKKLDKTAQRKLIAAELAWIKFRDTQCEFESDWYRGGSLAKQQYADCQARMTRARTLELKEALGVKDSM